MVTTSPSPIDAAAGLPPEFTLRLGPHSQAQVAALARILRDLGAEVDLEPEGGLVAHRPNE